MVDVAKDTDSDAIARRLGVVRERIDAACRRVRRSPEEVTLIGVSKTFPIEAVVAARDAGLTRFGENRVQDLVEKAEELPGRIRGGGVEWSMIGHLQRNKAKDVVEHADHFHALDSMRLARELDKRSRRDGRIMPCLVQVNVSGEDSKFGIEPQETHAFLDRLASLEHIRVEGLMAMATYADDPETVRPEFRRMRELFDDYEPPTGSRVEMTTLSLGMSNDFEVAIEEGSTHVRIGSAIFGTREAIDAREA